MCTASAAPRSIRTGRRPTHDAAPVLLIPRRKGMTMAYERPTLTKVGDFQKVTGLAGQGSPDLLGGHSLL
ncbi:hypothetical protein GCM10010274_42990 [Streptomyces lavendofoliae]|uniref:Lasso RiPP family leader peptide-containing protein n=2 Tax=Streptomyces TaxID=1883 RepID=A0A918M5A9_9ACTN|nr:hypothetical protein GCM10010274_42990 [Streptomyces lavendofoliae]